MNNCPDKFAKKRTSVLVRIVLSLSLLLLMARLVWVLPAALDHYLANKRAQTVVPGAIVTQPEPQAEQKPNK